MIYLMVIVVLAVIVGVVHARVQKGRDVDISAGMAKKYFEDMGMDLKDR